MLIALEIPVIAVIATVAPIAITKNGFDAHSPFNAAPSPVTPAVAVVEAVPTDVMPRAAFMASSDASEKAFFNRLNLLIGKSILFNTSAALSRLSNVLIISNIPLPVL